MYNFKKIEEEAEKLLDKKNIKKAVSDDASRKKLFSFLEGPPTANAPPGLHHLEVRTYKDIINKFRYMQGFSVPRKAGWDCHGLPVEVQIEKKLGLNSKKDILKHGEAKFIQECRESVFSFIKEWEKSTEKLGYWIDLDNRYTTMDNEYIESVWWSLKQIYDKNLLYEAHKVVPFCPRCETPLSSHEVALGYEKITEDSIVVKFRLIEDKKAEREKAEKEKKKIYLLVWTTTPWTLPSNLAIAVNPNLDYVYVKDEKDENKIYILAKELVKNFFERPKILKKVKGKQLINEKYEPLFPFFKELENKNAFRIIAGNFVTIEEGTGLVHMAPAFGEADYDACKKEGLPFVQPVDETGHFTAEAPEYSGMFIKDADPKIVKRLENENKIFKIIKYEHDYPFCWRCESPLMYYTIKSWFIKVTASKQRLIELNEKINWIPSHTKQGRFGQWLKEVKDWALSRKKFWGTPLPIWRCECGNEEIIGSIADLKKKSTRKILDNEIDLHKPWIDGIKIKCNRCGTNMSRVSDVIDCWYDSGAASFAQFHYPFESQDLFKKRFPYDFIAEAIDQTRGWFYTLHALSTILFDDIAYKNVICAGHIVDERGEKMSKSKGNILNPDKVLDEVGVDGTRLQFCLVEIGSQKRFGINMVKKDVWPFLNILWNTYQYYKQLSFKEKEETKIEDKWILSRLNSTIKETTENLEKYYIEKALRPIFDFVSNDVSRKYIQIVREREEREGSTVKKILREILDKISKVLAPYAPNITEVIHKEFGEGSIHLCEWPKADVKFIDEKLEKEMQDAQKVIEKILAARAEAKLNVRWPLANAEILIFESPRAEIQELIAKQCNLKKIIFKKIKKKETQVKLDTKLTEELEAEGYAREIARRVQEARKKAGLHTHDKIDLILQLNRKIAALLEKFDQTDYLEQKTNSIKLKIVELSTEMKGYKYKAEDKIKDNSITIFFNKINP